MADTPREPSEREKALRWVKDGCPLYSGPDFAWKYGDSPRDFVEKALTDGAPAAPQPVWDEDIVLANYRTITIPARSEHDGFHAMTITVPWQCLMCGAVRGEPYETISFDGSRRLRVHGWHNACGHIEPYSLVRDKYHAAAAAPEAPKEETERDFEDDYGEVR